MGLTVGIIPLMQGKFQSQTSRTFAGTTPGCRSPAALTWASGARTMRTEQNKCSIFSNGAAGLVGIPPSPDHPERDQGGSRIVAASRDQAQPSAPSAAPAVRWECRCQKPPVLLGTWQPGGRVNIKVRDRYWHLDGFGHVSTVCPRCARTHELDLGPSPPVMTSDRPAETG